MFGYITIGTNDREKAETSFDGVMGELGIPRYREEENFTTWALDPMSPALGVSTPFDGQPATVGNGTMIAIFAGTQEKVQATHARALELGGKDEGAPGLREGSNVFAAYFRDLDGNKSNVFCMPE